MERATDSPLTGSTARRGPVGRVLLASLLLAGAGAFGAASLQSDPRAQDGALGRLGARARLETTRQVEVVASSDRIRVRASYFWGQLGLAVDAAGPGGPDVARPRDQVGARLVVVPRSVSPGSQPAALAHLERAGLVVDAGEWGHAVGFRAQASTCAAAVTVLDGGLPTTYVLAGGGDDEAERLAEEAVDRLLQQEPPLRPQLVVWTGGRRALDVPLTSSGAPILRRAERHGVEVGGDPRELSARGEAWQRFQRLRVELQSQGLEAPTIDRIIERSGVGERALDGPVHVAGWYDPARRELELLQGVRGALEDALRDYLETVLLAQLGLPGEGWRLPALVDELSFDPEFDTLAEVAVDIAGVASGLGMPSFDELIRASPRCDPSLRAARRFQRATAGSSGLGGPDDREPLGAALRDSWGRPRDDDELGALLQRWAADLPRLAAARPRSRELTSGAALRVLGSPSAAARRLGSLGFRDELQRIVDLGYRAVVLEVFVPVAPPGGDERTSLPVALGGWGRHVTLEGDGALLAACAAARDLGLDVMLWPRLVASPSGPLGAHQVHGTPDRYALYGRRAALALEGVAWLAERAGATALVAFETEALPLASELISDTASDHRRASYRQLLDARAETRSLCRRALAPFRGALLGLVDGPRSAGLVAAEIEARAESIFVPSDGQPAVGLVVTTTVRIDLEPQSALQLAESLRSAAGRAGVVGCWLRDIEVAPPEAWAMAGRRGFGLVVVDR